MLKNSMVSSACPLPLKSATTFTSSRLPASGNAAKIIFEQEINIVKVKINQKMFSFI